MSDLPVHCQALLRAMDTPALSAWQQQLPAQLHEALIVKKHGDAARWQQALDALPAATQFDTDLNQACIRIGTADDLTDAQRDILQQQLMQLSPWRKGPYEFFGVHIDTEWRSDWKWQRVEGALDPLAGRRVLDVGCGNGYHAWRMAGAGADMVIGIDPSRLFMYQFMAAWHYLGDRGVYVLPLGIDSVPRQLGAFDTVFSMGVIYHRRSPVDHLLHLHDCLRPGGQLVLETLVVEGDVNTALVPHERYAQMNNVWFIPSCDMLLRWCERAGLADAVVVDVSVTRTDEQRATDWMRFQSLSDFLNPDDASRTVEGYPAPHRAVITARRPG